MGSYFDSNCCVLLNPDLKSTKDIFGEIVESNKLLKKILTK